MIRFLSLLTLLISYHAISNSLFAADALAATYPRLASLAIPAELLPGGCKLNIREELSKEGKRLPNGQITADRTWFRVGGERFAKLIETANIEAMYVGIYYEVDHQNDVGILGWACRSEETAKALHDKLAQSYQNEPDRIRLWLREKTVALLFRDPGVSPACFRRLEMTVQSRFAGDWKAADLLVKDGRLDRQADEAAQRFMKALKAEDLDAVMDSVDIPFFISRNNISTLDELRQKFAEIFQKKSLSAIEFKLKEIHRIEFAPEQLDVRDRETIKQILSKDDRVVIETVKTPRNEETIVVLVRLKDGAGKVAGFR